MNLTITKSKDTVTVLPHSDGHTISLVRQYTCPHGELHLRCETVSGAVLLLSKPEVDLIRTHADVLAATEQQVGSITDETPSVVLEVFSSSGDSVGYAEAGLVDVYRGGDLEEGETRTDNYALFAGDFGNGREFRTFNVRVFLDDCPTILQQPIAPDPNNCYPRQAAFVESAQRLLENTNRNRTFTAEQIAEFFGSVIGEYEHGTADVTDVERVNLDQYAEVAADLLLGLFSVRDKQ